MAQSLHRMDMRLRLGLLRDTTTAERRAVAEAAARKHKPTSPTVKTQAESKAEEDAIAKAKAAATEAEKPAPKPHIRPLSESKAIESGASFISESFLFIVAGGLIVYESLRSRRKETTRREDVESRLVELEQSEKNSRRALVALETELLQQKSKNETLSLKSSSRILPREVWEVEQKEEAEDAKEEGWLSQIGSYVSSIWDSVSNPQSSVTPESAAPASKEASNAQPESSSAGQADKDTQSKSS